jgi:hypothetical protein
MLIRRQKRGQPYGWTQLPWPAPGQPGTLRPGILAGRRHPFSLVIHGPPTSAEYNKWDSSTLAVSDVDPRSSAGRRQKLRAASNRWGTVFASLQRAPPRSSKSDCSTGPLMFLHTVSFLGAYSICMHHTSMFCVCPPLTLFPTVFPSCVFLFSLLMCTPM